MPPRRGLKANKNKRPAENDSSEPKLDEPSDEDALTLQDLFELKMQVAGHLESADEITVEQQEEASNLLRGILHGADRLTSVDKTDEQRAALGLSDPRAASHIAYLQGYALEELGLLLDEGSSATVAAAAAAAIGSSAVADEVGITKRRKVDSHEPKSLGAWLVKASEQYAAASAALASDELASSHDLWSALVQLSALKCRCEQALERLRTGEEAEDSPTQLAAALASSVATLDPSVGHSDFYGEYGNPIVVAVKAVGLAGSLVDTDDLASEDRLEALESLTSLVDHVAPYFSAAPPQERVCHASIRADLLMARFILEEDLVEDKYRGEGGDEGNSGGDTESSDDEDQVPPLPDAPDVREARTKGKQVIAACEETIALYKNLPATKQSPETLKGYYTKLQEALLTYSALINPDQEQEQAENEASLARVIEEGGLDKLEDLE